VPSVWSKSRKKKSALESFEEQGSGPYSSVGIDRLGSYPGILTIGSHLKPVFDINNDKSRISRSYDSANSDTTIENVGTA